MAIKKTVKKSNKKKIKKSTKNQKGGTLTDFQMKKYKNIVELEEYEGDLEDDYGLDLYDDIVEKKQGYDICRFEISKGYISAVFNNKNAIGYIARIKGEYVGFILYEKKENHIFLYLICSIKNKLTKGIPVGQILMYKLEKIAKKMNTNIKADATLRALPFYLANGWKKSGRVKNDKQRIKKSFKIKETKAKKKIVKKGFFARFFGL